jgi:hypothetical protein
MELQLCSLCMTLWLGQGKLYFYVYATYFCVFDTLLWEVYLKWVGSYSRQDLQILSDPRN